MDLLKAKSLEYKENLEQLQTEIEKQRYLVESEYNKKL